LRGLIVANWVCGALIFALLLLSFQAEEWTWRALGVGGAAEHDDAAAGMRSIMVVGILAVPIAFIVLSRLFQIVQSVRAGNAFTVENAGRLKTIAWSLLALEVLHYCVVAIASSLATRGIPLHIGNDFNLTGWLAILLLFVLAQVFLQGARMHDELEATV